MRRGLRSIRGKIQLAIALTSAGVVLLLAALLLFTQYTSARRDMVRQLRTLGRMATSNVAAPLAFNLPEEARDALHALYALPDLTNAAILQLDGTTFVQKSFANHAAITFPAIPPHNNDHIWRKDALLLYTVIQLDGERQGVLWLARDLGSFHRRIREIILWAVYFYLLAVLLAALVAWLLQRVITRPILELAHTTERITNEGPAATRARKRADDEIGALVDSFNQMLDHIAEQNDRLLDRERCYRTLFSQAASAVFLEDNDRRILEANQTAGAMFRQAQETLVGKSTVALIHAPDGLPSPKVGERTHVAKAEAHLADGTKLPLEVTVTGIENAGQHLFLTTAVDMTDRLRAQRSLEHSRDELKRQVAAATAELREANQNLQHEMDERRRLERQMMMSEKIKGLGLMAGGIAHDFNNLLQTILGNTDLFLIEEEDLSEEGKHSIREIQSAARTAAGLASQMLAYAGKSALRIVPLHVNALIRSMTPLIEAAVTKNARCHYELSEQLPMVDADEGQVRQLIMNLVTNAAEALPPEGGAFTIRTGQRQCDQDFLRRTLLHEDLPSGRYLFVSVNDTGCGIEPDTVERIFDPFFSTKFAGRGLGLAGVLGIVRAHRAAITVESTPGVGSMFTVYFPITRSGPAVLDDEPTAVVTLNEDWQGHGRVLVADDEEGVRHVAKRMFRLVGFEVEVAENGEQAVEICRTRHREIDLYVLDMSMPGIGGVGAARQILALAPDARIILSSAYPREQVEAEKGTLRVDGFLRKPYERDALRSQLARILGD
jgi:PAS domain S-box-containing protein